MYQALLEKGINKLDYDYDEIKNLLESIIEKEVDYIKFGAFLVLLRAKGEKKHEISAFVDTFLNKAVRLNIDLPDTIDTCGTGGDGKNTFNISTASAFLLSALGLNVIKHGNRGITSKSGSADIIEALGIDINASTEKLEEGIKKVGFGFIFAPNFHPAMKKVAPVRKELGVRTIFNLLGPVLNPANLEYQVIGTFDKEAQLRVSEALEGRRKRFAVIHSEDGLDEVSTAEKTYVVEYKNGGYDKYYIQPEDFGIKRFNIDDIKGFDANVNAQIMMDVFNGIKSPYYYAVLVNTVFALYIANKITNFSEGINIAEKAILDGSAKLKLNQIINFYKKG